MKNYENSVVSMYNTNFRRTVRDILDIVIVENMDNSDLVEVFNEVSEQLNDINRVAGLVR